MPWSDLNMVVCLKSRDVDEVCKDLMVQRFVDCISTEKSLIVSISLETRSSLLLAKLQTTSMFGGIQVEIIFKLVPNTYQARNEEIIKDYMRKYPVCRPVYLILKFLLHSSAVGDPASNGLNSLSLLLMIVALLQNLESKEYQIGPSQVPVDPLPKSNTTVQISVETKESENKKVLENKARNYLAMSNPGKVLLEFFYFYGFTFDYNNFFISTRQSSEKQVSPFLEKQLKKNDALMIVSPHNKGLIITKSFKHTKTLIQFFKLEYNRLFASCKCKAVPLSKLLGLETAFVKLKPVKAIGQIQRSNLANPTNKEIGMRVVLKLIDWSEQTDALSANSEIPTPKSGRLKLKKRRLSSNSSTYEVGTCQSGFNLLESDKTEFYSFQTLMTNKTLMN